MNSLLKSEIVQLFEAGHSLCSIHQRTKASKGTLSRLKNQIENPYEGRTANRHKCPTCGRAIITETCLACSLVPVPISEEEEQEKPAEISLRLHKEDKKRYKALKAAKRRHGEMFDLNTYLNSREGEY